MKKLIIGIGAILLVAALVICLLVFGGKKDDAAKVEPEEQEVTETKENGEEDEESAQEKAESLTSELIQEAMDSGLLTEEMLGEATDFYEEMKKETEGMSNDEAVDYWLREALVLVEDELPEIKQEQISEVLDQLHEAGYLSEEAVYDAENWIFTFIYESGIPGGVDIGEKSPVINTPQSAVPQPVHPQSSTRRAPALRSVTTGQQMQVAVLNGFEDTPYRTDFYLSLQEDWEELGVDLRLDRDVTVADMASLGDYDVVVFSMHGSTYLDQPVLCINEVATSDTDQLYYDYLAYEQSVAKMMYIDGSCGYWIMPSFFTNRYGSNGLDGTVFFSESCCFYGCECYTDEPDPVMASALYNASAEVIMGYCNSVGADYSRNVMKATLEAMFLGETAYDSLAAAMSLYGDDDGWEDPSQDKFIAYPTYMGDGDTVILMGEEEEPAEEAPAEEEAPVEEEAPAEEEKDDDDSVTLRDLPFEELSDLEKLLYIWEYGAPPEQEEQPEEDWLDQDLALGTVDESLQTQLIGVYAQGRRDGTFYLPYTNDTPYTFTLELDLDYWYGGKKVHEELNYRYELKPGDYIEIPVNFPAQCDAWNVWYLYSNIWYKDEFIY